MLKILAHLLFIQDLNKDQSKIVTLFEFIDKAYEMTTEKISFLYFIRVTMLITKKADIDHLYKNKPIFRKILDRIADSFIENLSNTSDDLIKEILLYQVDYWRFLLNTQSIHVFFK